jgi:hypothetical protein
VVALGECLRCDGGLGLDMESLLSLESGKRVLGAESMVPN